MCSSDLYLVQNIVDGNDRSLLMPYETGFSGSTYPTILGSRVIINPDFPDRAASAKCIAYGSPREAFTVRMNGGVRLAQSSELYFKSQSLALISFVSFDSKVVNNAAMKRLVMAAS